MLVNYCVRICRDFWELLCWEWLENIQDHNLQIEDRDNVFRVFAAIRHCAGTSVTNQDAHRSWRSACGQIICASRIAEELLQPDLPMEVFPERSDVFTHPTCPSHLQAALAQSVTAVTGSFTDASQVQRDLKASDLPEKIAGGETEAKLQALEHKLLELQNQHKHRAHPDIAATLHELGCLSQDAGDFKQAKQHFDESLRMGRSLHGDKDHPDIAGTLYTLGHLFQHAGDLKQAKQHFDESLRMNLSLHGDKDHPDIAATLHALGCLSHRAGDLKQAKQHLDESLRMKRSLHGDKDHPSIAATLHELGCLSQSVGDFKQAKQHLDESLLMKRSLHGDKDHTSIAATLQALGLVSLLAGDFKQAKQHFDESLRMGPSLHGYYTHLMILILIVPVGCVAMGLGYVLLRKFVKGLGPSISPSKAFTALRNWWARGNETLGARGGMQYAGVLWCRANRMVQWISLCRPLNVALGCYWLICCRVHVKVTRAEATLDPSSW